MFIKKNYILFALLCFYLSSCSLSDNLKNFGDNFFENKFYYKNGHERVQLEEQDKKNIPNIHPVKISSDKIEGAKGLKPSRNLIFRFNLFCISGFLASPKILLLPRARGPNSILP